MLEIARSIRAAARVNFALFVIVGVLAAGIWPVCYLTKRAKSINEAIKTDLIPSWLSPTLIVLLVVTLVCKIFGEGDEIAGLGVLTSLAMGVVYMVWAFQAKKTLEALVIDQFGISTYKLNAFYTFFFTVFYIVYCLNDLETFVQRNGPKVQQPVAAHA